MSRFSIIPAAALVDSRLTLRELSVLGALGVHTDRSGWCHPSSARIGEMLGVSGPMVRRSITALAGYGYLQVLARANADGGQTTNRIRVLFDVEHPAEALRMDLGAVTPEVAPPVTPGVTPPATPGVTRRNPLNAPTEGKDKARKRALPGEHFETPEWVPRDLWLEWLEVRRKKRAVATDKALQLSLDDLAGFRAAGENPADVLKQAIKRSWTGLFSTKRGNGNDRPQATGGARRESEAERVERINREHDDRDRAAGLM